MFRILKTLFSAITLLPLPLLSVVAFCLGRLCYYCLPFRKRVIAGQMRLVFKGTKSDAEIRALIKANYVHYASLLFEFMWLLSPRARRPGFVERHFSSPDEGVLKEALAGGKGVILIGGHLGAWEALGLYCTARISPLTVTVKLISAAWVQRLREEMQAHTGMTLIDNRMGMRRIILLLQALRRGHMVGIFLDQYRHGEAFAPFLGHDARTNSAAAVLWRKTGAPVIMIHMIRERLGHYRVDLRRADPPAPPEPADETQALLDINIHFNRHLGEAILKHPDQWLWAHRRFKDNPTFDYGRS